MVQKVTGFKAQDGKVFDTEAQAVAHEKTLLLGVAVGAAVAALGFEGARVYLTADTAEAGTPLTEFLLKNSEVLVDALTPPKKERKPRTPKAPAEPSPELGAALTQVSGTAQAVEETEARVVTGAAHTEAVSVVAGPNADAELDALLGGEVTV